MPTYLATNPTYFSPSGAPWGLAGGDRFNNAGDVGTFGPITVPSGAYLIGFFYGFSGNRSVATVHVIKDGATTLATFGVNQQLPTDGSAGAATASAITVFDGTTIHVSPGVFDVTSGTFTALIHTPDANFAIANTLYLLRIGPAGTLLPLPPTGYAPDGTTVLLYTPGVTDPLGSTLTTLTLGHQAAAAVVSAGNDTHSGNVQVQADFWVTALSGNDNQYVAGRADGTAFHNGYYGLAGLDTGAIRALAYASGAGNQIASPYVAGTFAANHLYRLTENVSTSVKTLVEIFVQDLSNAGKYLTDLGTWSPIPQPCATTIDDPQTTGFTPIAGAGRNVLGSYNKPLLTEAYSVSAVPMPGITPYTSVYPLKFRCDTAGNPIQIHNAGYWFDPSLGLYLMVGVDCSLGSQFIVSDNYPNPGGVVLYTSPDFLNWTYIRKITTTNIGGAAFDWTLFPRIRKHPTNGKYYLFIECGFGSLVGTVVSILTATDPRGGPWTVQNNAWQPGGAFTPNGFNFTLDGGVTYLLMSNGQSGTNALFHYAALNAGWTDLATAWNTLTITGLPADIHGSYALESPCVSHIGAWFYACGSQGTGWSPNPNQFAKSATLAGPYAACPYAYVSSAVAGSAASYGTQLNDVFTLPDGTAVLTADQWLTLDFRSGGHMQLPLAFDGGGNPTAPWATWVPPATPPPVPSGPNALTLLSLIGGKSVPSFPLGRTIRIGVFHQLPFSIPVNAITVQLSGINGSLAFGTDANLIAASDGSATAAAIPAGVWTYSNTFDNSTAGNLYGDVYRGVDLTSLAATLGTGPVQFILQKSCDNGTKWPTNNSGLSLPSIGAVSGLLVGNTAPLPNPS